MFAIIYLQGDAMKVISRPIDTIVVFRGGSKPLPYKFKYTDAAGGSREGYVGRILLAEKLKVAGRQVFTYDCQSNIEGRERRYQIKYHVDDQRWELSKM